MKTIFVSLAVSMLISLSSCCGSDNSSNGSCRQKEGCGSKEESCCAKAACADQKVLRHVVLFGFKPEVTPEQVKEIEIAFATLPTLIEQIKGYEWGINNSPEGLNNGLSHCFFLTFTSDADRDAYLVHPAHQEFGKLLGSKLSGVTVLDYWQK